MVKHRRNDLLIPFLLVVFDLIAIIGAFHAAYYLRFEPWFSALVPIEKGVPGIASYTIASLVVAPIWVFMFNGRKVYRPRRPIEPSGEFFSILKTVSLGLLIIMSMAFFYRGFSYSRIILILIWFFSIGFLYAGRYIVYRYEQFLYVRGKELRNVIIVGANKVAQSIALQIQQRPTMGYHLFGYVSPVDERIEGISVPRLGTVSDIPDLVSENRIETIVVCLTEEKNGDLAAILDMLVGTSVQILLQFEFIGIMPTRLRTFEMFGLPFLGVKDIPMTTWGRISKRVFDLLFSAFVLVVTAPLAGLITILIWLESGRPVFFKQVRVGMYGEQFDCLKFRTMRKDAEKESGPTWTKKGDPRVTKIGRFLRRTSLDELPQFLNVIRGEMSVVGPRPERPVFVSQFQQYVPKYLERHRVKTGLTGWAQVNGLRGEVPIAERTKFDLYYIENWSLFFDLRIILKTLYTIVFGKDAY
ncbi:MAG: undecaprenyl-phosphate glucose phosphotransferase [Ectothiorhodospiraceae bacterium]|nr:undecaprenyl-phosphate glucose phosphotransferase [Ectothiorhodospiraceae bacterium]